MIINENPAQNVENKESRITMFIDEEDRVAAPMDNLIDDDTSGIEQTDLDEALEDEPDIQTNGGKSTENMNKKDEYNLRNRNLIRQPSRYEACFTLIDEPRSFQEAISGEHPEDWMLAIQEELHAHEESNTWTIVPMPPDCKPVGCKWVFKIKENSSTSKIRFKARLCTKGFSQKAGIDFEEIFSPVVRYDSVRVLIAIAAIKDLEIRRKNRFFT